MLYYKTDTNNYLSLLASLRSDSDILFTYKLGVILVSLSILNSREVIGRLEL
jgi:hypothetical protein